MYNLIFTKFNMEEIQYLKWVKYVESLEDSELAIVIKKILVDATRWA